ncbi:hypothetical protein [Streptosporangium canum]|uniref:hypothetical protein n=1 Tax=Streptosporangium canum TaxID=324952 RepID=UPI0033B4AE73
MRHHSPSPAAPTLGELHEVGGRRLPPRSATKVAAAPHELLRAAQVPVVGHSPVGLEPLYERWDEFMPEQFSLAGRAAQSPAEASIFGHVVDDQVARGRDGSLRGE